ncbi:hypothetical protein [Nocardia harenae]|uniref:hypothetical protein n=1 Tax=Nocardia harenae TaxID=358707 RepID=UPI00082AF9D1|nr:hypothetical protein [Nocardia harenae]
MSEINDDKPRARRRAMRSAGPPPADTGSDAGAGAAPADAARAVDDGGSAAPASRPGAVRAKVEPAASDSASSTTKPITAEPTPAAAGPVAAGDPPSAKAAPATAKPAAEVALDKDGDETPAEPTESTRSWKRLALTAAAAIAAIAIVASAVLSTLAVRANDARDERRNEYLQTARQTVLNLTTIRADSAREDIDRILSVASGDFKTEFDGRVDPFTDIVQQAKVVSTGEIVEAALERDDENSAQVLVAAKQTLTNAGQAEPQTRYYRFRITVARGDEGLTASKVEFVA